MKKILIGVFTLFAVFSTVEAKSNKEQDRVLIDKVAMWQVNHQPQVKHHDLEWTNAVLFRGMVECVHHGPSWRGCFLQQVV